jgi:hypothetical protein
MGGMTIRAGNKIRETGRLIFPAGPVSVWRSALFPSSLSRNTAIYRGDTKTLPFLFGNRFNGLRLPESRNR